MSHSGGAVKFSDGKVLYYEYNGTADVPISHLYETWDDVDDNWRKHQWLYCDCKRDEPVMIVTSCGGGFGWNGRACRFCYAITDGFDPFSEEREGYIDGMPEWFAEIIKND